MEVDACTDVVCAGLDLTMTQRPKDALRIRSVARPYRKVNCVTTTVRRDRTRPEIAPIEMNVYDREAGAT